LFEIKALNKVVLLTGGLGYIGSHAACLLATSSYEPIILDDLSNSRLDTLDRIQSVVGRGVRFIEGDVRDSSLVLEILREHGVSCVMHFAGLKAVGESVEKPESYYDVNVGGAISLVRAMREAQVFELVFSSSATVYGDPQYLPIDESHPTHGVSPYGQTKLMIETILNDVCTADPRWRVASLRYFNPVGAHETGLIGEDPTGIPNNLMPYIARVVTGELDHLRVFGSDYDTRDGTGVRDYIHIVDLVEGHLAALAFLDREIGYHCINLGTGYGCTVLEMLREFEKASGRQVPYQLVARRPGDVAACFAEVQKAKQLLGWSAKRDLADMCNSVWNYQSKCR
jgi:UDP-glucose 4-epimerase